MLAVHVLFVLALDVLSSMFYVEGFEFWKKKHVLSIRLQLYIQSFSDNKAQYNISIQTTDESGEWTLTPIQAPNNDLKICGPTRLTARRTDHCSQAKTLTTTSVYTPPEVKSKAAEPPF